MKANIIGCKPIETNDVKGIAVAFGYNDATTAKSEKSIAASTGNYGIASASGDYSLAIVTGEKGAATALNPKSIAISICGGKAKGAKGAYLLLTECENDSLNASLVKVDGTHIKENTYYTLIRGQVTQAN